MFPDSNGYINTTQKIEKISNNNDDSSDKVPLSLVFKEYGGNRFAEHLADAFQINPPSTHLLISYELSRRGWGPKLYAAMENGRIEEYIDCHTLDPAEAFTDQMSAEVAKAMARFHSLDLPLTRDPTCFLESAKLSFEKEIPAMIKWLEAAEATDECLQALDFLLRFPFRDEYNWITSMVKKISHRQVLMTGDPNYLNRLVKRQKPANAEENRCMIIDFDFTQYYDRGFDIGGHFAFRIIDAESSTNKLTGLPYPTREERDSFLRHYLDECARIFADFDPKSLDNIDQLRLEADVYAPFYILWVIFVCGGFYKIYHVEPYMYTVVHGLIDTFYSLKQDFCRTYKHLVSE